MDGRMMKRMWWFTNFIRNMADFKKKFKAHIFLSSISTAFPLDFDLNVAYGVPGISPHTAFQSISKSSLCIPCSLHPPSCPSVSVLWSNTNDNIFNKSSKIELLQWYICCLPLPPTCSSKKQLLPAHHVRCNKLAVRYQHALAVLILQPQTAHIGKTCATSPNRLPSGSAANHFYISELVFNLFSVLVMIIFTLYPCRKYCNIY